MKRLALAAMLCGARVAAAEDDCRTVDVDFTPSEKLQIVAWIEDAAGNYIDTAFITQTTGLRGLGNRTGLMDLHSGPGWPYGSRDDVFPIWAHRHGLVWPQVVWQSAFRDCQLDTTFAESSYEPYYCRPMMQREPEWDAGTCATQSAVWTDKGKFSETRTSLYPPRADLTRTQTDSGSVASYAGLNPFDTISQATPAGDLPYRFSWLVPETLANGEYTLRVEVSKEFDFNATYTQATYPTSQCVWTTYGVPYRGQPSVIYEVPITIGAVEARASSLDYAGYSGLDGTLHAPDATISTTTPGSGASRLRIAIGEDSTMYRVRATSRPEQDSIAPNAVSEPSVAKLEPTSAELTFTAPGDDGSIGTVAGYEIRYRVGYTLDEESFASATPIDAGALVPAGQLQTIALEGLAPSTPYVVGIRPYDNCKHTGPLIVTQFETPSVEVGGCGCSSGDPLGLAIGLLAFGVRRRRLR